MAHSTLDDFFSGILRTRADELKRLPYRDYLKTEHWQKVRAHAIERANRQCESSGSREHLEAHHLTYERRGEELPSDVIALCRLCHRRRHPQAPARRQ